MKKICTFTMSTTPTNILWTKFYVVQEFPDFIFMMTWSTWIAPKICESLIDEHVVIQIFIGHRRSHVQNKTYPKFCFSLHLMCNHAMRKILSTTHHQIPSVCKKLWYHKLWCTKWLAMSKMIKNSTRSGLFYPHPPDSMLE